MLNEYIVSLCNYRIEKAESCLKSSVLLKDFDDLSRDFLIRNIHTLLKYICKSYFGGESDDLFCRR